MELRPASVDKATAARAILKDLNAKEEVDFVLCIGDGKTDEVVFAHLTAAMPDALSATVGKKQTEAKFYLESVSSVTDLLNGFSKLVVDSATKASSTIH